MQTGIDLEHECCHICVRKWSGPCKILAGNAVIIRSEATIVAYVVDNVKITAWSWLNARVRSWVSPIKLVGESNCLHIGVHCG